MPLKEILLLGNPALYRISSEITREELPEIPALVQDLHDTLLDFRKRYGAGRAIAAPQIGVFKRLIYMFTDKAYVFINPQLTDLSKEKILVWDDCMSFPDLLVKVRRAAACRLRYRELNWQEQELALEDDLSELLQHEVDHLDGILAVSRAVGENPFALRSQKHLLDQLS
jgi:peptide deformylase